MKIEMQRVNKAVHFIAYGSDGHSILMDGSESIGGEGKGVRPMETVLMGLAGCSSIDMVMILDKMRQKLEDIRIEVVAERADDIPSVFTKIHVKFFLKGDLKEKKVAQAVNMAFEKYCSVSRMLEPTVEITSSYVIN